VVNVKNLTPRTALALLCRNYKVKKTVIHRAKLFGAPDEYEVHAENVVTGSVTIGRSKVSHDAAYKDALLKTKAPANPTLVGQYVNLKA
jgi:hypothetical protein